MNCNDPHLNVPNSTTSGRAPAAAAAAKQDLELQMMQKQTLHGCTALCSVVLKGCTSVRLNRSAFGSTHTLQLTLSQKAKPGSQVSLESGSLPAKSSQLSFGQVPKLLAKVHHAFVIDLQTCHRFAMHKCKTNTARHCISSKAAGAINNQCWDQALLSDVSCHANWYIILADCTQSCIIPIGYS